MFAVYAAEPSPKDPLAALRIGDRPDPEVPPGHVAVDVIAATLNMHDVFTLRGVGIRPEQFPMILGWTAPESWTTAREVVIHAVIASPDWPRGDETLDPKRSLPHRELPGHVGRAGRGAPAAQRSCPSRPACPFADAACLGTAWLTAYRMLFIRSGLRPGQTMLVQGASGGVSTALVQLASRRVPGLGHRAHRGEARARTAARRRRDLRVRRPPARPR